MLPLLREPARSLSFEWASRPTRPGRSPSLLSWASRGQATPRPRVWTVHARIESVGDAGLPGRRVAGDCILDQVLRRAGITDFVCLAHGQAHGLRALAGGRVIQSRSIGDSLVERGAWGRAATRVGRFMGRGCARAPGERCRGERDVQLHRDENMREHCRVRKMRCTSCATGRVLKRSVRSCLAWRCWRVLLSRVNPAARRDARRSPSHLGVEHATLAPRAARP
jgi:hypothetical protein